MIRAFFLTVLFSLTASAGDRVGNGGGVWACTRPDGTFQSAMLVDLFEARSEFQLSIPDAGIVQTPNEIYHSRLTWLAAELPAFSQVMAPYFARIEKNVVMTHAQLQWIDDSNNRTKPLDSNCAGGRWDYVQFANYTLYDRLLIRADLWDGAFLPNIDKAALLVHEAVYLMLREQNGDYDSARARQITGLLFSNLPTSEISIRLNALLVSPSPVSPVPRVPVPVPPPTNVTTNVSQWTCMTKNPQTNLTFLASGEVQMEAEFNVLKACESDVNGYRSYCQRTPDCAPIQSSKPTVTCTIYNAQTNLTFFGKGRNAVEAKATGLQACEVDKNGYRSYCKIDRCSN